MKSAGTWVWYVGRALQVLGLVTVGGALVVGLQTNDSRQEMTFLGIGAAEFLLGVLCLKGSATE
ncbi:MAG: hypothetical protein JST16_04200 [Bdellovibrionales bacterium]|nr:hypothetical protein [Bdellovibrionales bacterium]